MKSDKMSKWTTNTGWIHIACAIIKHETVRSHKPFHKSQVTSNVIRRVKQSGNSSNVNNYEVAVGWAFYYLAQCGYLKRVGVPRSGIYQATKSTGAQNEHQVQKTLFTAHRSYSDKHKRAKQKTQERLTRPKQNISAIIHRIEKDLQQLREAVATE